jgi:hypothetical protein
MCYLLKGNNLKYREIEKKSWIVLVPQGYKTLKIGDEVY